jgi:putative peptidoglycan lipid II flippase
MLLLRATLNKRIGSTGLSALYSAKLWTAAAAGAAAAWGIKSVLPALHPAVAATFILGVYGVVFFGMTFVLKIPEATSSLQRFLPRRR